MGTALRVTIQLASPVGEQMVGNAENGTRWQRIFGAGLTGTPAVSAGRRKAGTRLAPQLNRLSRGKPRGAMRPAVARFWT